jgi:chemotaxis protein CheD
MTTATEIAETSLPLTHVRIGEIRTASAGLLKVTLGSCVAIALINRLEGICGLAHCFLPFAPEGYNGTSGRYADRAAANLVQRIAPNPAIRKALKAFLCGGNRLLTPEASSRFQVGQMNVDAARASLKQLNLRFHELETGADEGTNAILDCSNFTFTCGKISNMLIGDKESPCN